jgi:uncharacterized protein YjbI with pentapeptide repeats
MSQITQAELNRILKEHQDFLKGISGGVRASVKFRDLTGLDFRRANLVNADFSGSCLNETNLSHCKCSNASFFACDLNKANLSHGDFARCDFRGASIVNADLTEANFDSADLRRGVMMNYLDAASEDKWNKSGETKLSGSMVRDTDMSHVLAHNTNFSDANMVGVKMHDARLNGSDLSNANMQNADLSGTNLTGANMKNAVVDGIILTAVEGDRTEIAGLIEQQNARKSLKDGDMDLKALIKEHTSWIQSAGRDGQQLNLSEYDLSDEKDLRNYPLTVIVASGSKFTGLYLEGVKMESSVLNRSDFRDCHMKNADFRGSSFKESLFTRADLSNANFSALKVKRPDGSEMLQSVDLSQSRMAFAILDGANFSNANLQDVDFSHASLKNCDFSNCNLKGASFEDADLEGTTLPE